MSSNTRVLILGGGFGGLYAALEFEKRKDPDFDSALDVFSSKDFVQYLHQRAPTISRSENQPPPPSSAACDRAAATQKQP
jgi:NADH dehydrogenase FAD-containing subunit